MLSTCTAAATPIDGAALGTNLASYTWTKPLVPNCGAPSVRSAAAFATGRKSARSGYGSMAIRVDEQCPSTPTVVVQENLIGRAGGLEYLIVTAPVSLSLESS